VKVKFCMACGAGLVAGNDAEGRERMRCPAPDCGWVHYGNPTPVVAAIVEHPDGVLLARNKGWPEGMFGLVTGYLEAGETPEAGVLREVQEELGLAAEIVSLVGVHAFELKNELLVTYHVRAEGEVQLGDELAAYKVVPEAKLRPWPVGTGHAVRDWLRGRGREDV
jgi:NAD+ diphosphatase